jgi:DNA-binding transcriptional regulator YiaG
MDEIARVHAMTWAKEIRAFLDRRGMTQEAFARLVGVSYTTVNRWVQGHHEPSPLVERMVRRTMTEADEHAGVQRPR